MELFYRIHRRLLRRLVGQLQGLSAGEMMVLWKVNKRGFCRVTDLAQEICISPSTLTGILDRLVERGLLERFPDPDDRRVILLKGTPRLKGFIEEVAEAIEKELIKIFGAMPVADYQRLLVDLELLLKYLEQEKGDGYGKAGDKDGRGHIHP
ncbi:MAG TPA: MarR family transcriptional regulator [Syntrophomonadaceae bacterium]|nr:MarR family transcriptional regulator [Syntrophomonadaceae bacterium]